MRDILILFDNKFDDFYKFIYNKVMQIYKIQYFKYISIIYFIK